jgi:hypothetical protein
MNHVKLIAVIFLMAIGFCCYAQETSSIQPTIAETKLIAVVNSANWCGVCKVNGERFRNIVVRDK